VARVCRQSSGSSTSAFRSRPKLDFQGVLALLRSSFGGQSSIACAAIVTDCDSAKPPKQCYLVHHVEFDSGKRRL
jgi:hypothetical protein